MLFCRNVYLLLRRYKSSTNYFSMANVLSSKDIRGMKILNKELFKVDIDVPCIVVKVNNLKKALQIIKPYLLKMVAFQSVRIRDDNTKEILLNPEIVRNYDDLKSVDREALSELEEKINFDKISIRLTYENWKASDLLNSILPKEVGSVRGYSIIGHILHLNLKEELHEYKKIIGEILLDKVPQVKTVVNKVDIIENDFRTFKLDILAGVDDFLVKVSENQCLYKFDFSKVYWNPRLSTEHSRVIDDLNPGDYLYDACAGVGPFSIPAAKKGCTVFANDLNTVAIEYLKENIRCNKVEKSITTFVKDAGAFIKEDFKKHFINLTTGNFQVKITMNLPALAVTFLPNFKGLYNQDDYDTLKALPIPEVYVYCFIKDKSDSFTAARQLIVDQLSMNVDDEIKSVNFVRNVAPNKDMMRVIVRLTPKILITQKRTLSPIFPTDIKKFNNKNCISSQDIVDKQPVENEKTQEK